MKKEEQVEPNYDPSSSLLNFFSFFFSFLHSPSLSPLVKRNCYSPSSLSHYSYGFGFNSSVIAAIKCEVMVLGYNRSKNVEREDSEQGVVDQVFHTFLLVFLSSDLVSRFFIFVIDLTFQLMQGRNFSFFGVEFTSFWIEHPVWV